MADKKKIINLVMDEELHRFLKIYAAENNTTMNDILLGCVKKIKNEKNKK